MAAAVLFAAPAFANSSANADIAAPLRAAQAAKQSAMNSGDSEFRVLFSSWRAMDKAPGFIASAAPVANSLSAATGLPNTSGMKVSIPSRMPLETAAYTSGFGMRMHPVLGRRKAHKGIDLASPIGTPIHATADGMVSKAEWFSSYGLYAQIEHGGDLETRYGHMSRLNVAAGQMVRKGDVIGYVGSTGRSTGPHLHYEVRVAGEAVNPVPYMQGDASTVQLALANRAKAHDASMDEGGD